MFTNVSCFICLCTSLSTASEMTYCVSGGALNSTHSLTHFSFCDHHLYFLFPAVHRHSQEFVWGRGALLRPEGYKYVLEVGDTVKDKSDSIPFLVLCQSWILGGGYNCAPSSLLLATPRQLSALRFLFFAL